MNRKTQNMLKIIVPTMISVLILFLLLYVLTDVGYSNFCFGLMTSAPLWFESIVTIIFVPLTIAVGMYDKIYGLNKDT